MTWGQLRFQLQTSAPGLSPDLLDEFLNGRYEQVLEAADWLGLKAHANISTQAAYQSGTDTVTLTVGSAAVTVTGTTWPEAITGLRIYRPGDSVIYTVTWTSTTTFNLDRPYEGHANDAAGTVYAGSAYVFMQNIYTLPSDCRTVVTILDPVTGFPLTKFSKDQLDESCGPRTLLQDPTSYAVYDDSDENSPPVLHQVELFPPPLSARAFPVEYLRAANAFDGTNTSDSPLPWVSQSVLLYGCRADVQAYLASQAAAAANAGSAAAHDRMAGKYEAKFQDELARLLRVEHQQRRKPTPLRMHQRFTRHRLERAGRGLINYWGPGQGGPN